MGVEGRSLVADIEGVGQAVIPCDETATGKVSLAIRPEKLQLSFEEPHNECIKIRSRVVNIVYFGGTSQVFLENENGIQLTADISNKESNTATSIIIGNEMWVSWKAAETLVLTH